MSGSTVYMWGNRTGGGVPHKRTSPQSGLGVARGNKDLKVCIQENDAAWLNSITTSAPEN